MDGDLRLRYYPHFSRSLSTPSRPACCVWLCCSTVEEHRQHQLTEGPLIKPVLFFGRLAVPWCRRRAHLGVPGEHGVPCSCAANCEAAAAVAGGEDRTAVRFGETPKERDSEVEADTATRAGGHGGSRRLCCGRGAPLRGSP